VKRIVVAVIAAAAFSLSCPVALADPGQDDPGFVIDGDGAPGQEHYPHVCATAEIACGLHRDPGAGTWLRSGVDDK
jgi:hypothetical protein